MIINLFEIPEEGKSFTYNQETKEVSEILKDLIGSNNYTTEFFIKPLNSKDFELKGNIATKTKEICAQCGLGIQFPVKAKFHEILIPPQEMTRDGHYSRSYLVSDDDLEGPDSTEYQAEMRFNIGEYLHEVIALTVPYNPTPAEDAKGNCLDCGQNKESFRSVLDQKNDEPPTETSPFASLKGFKFKN